MINASTFTTFALMDIFQVNLVREHSSLKPKNDTVIYRHCELTSMKLRFWHANVQDTRRYVRASNNGNVVDLSSIESRWIF